jgi:hypothetical protein
MAAPIVTGGTSAYLDPISDPQSWDYAIIGGQQSPLIHSMDGFDRPNGFQEKRGKGSIGATLTMTSKPPTSGSITFNLWRSADFQAWGVFSQQFFTRPQTTPDKAALSIYHPSLADIQLTSVVVGKPDGKGGVTRIRHAGKGLYLVTVHFIEYVPTPQISAVSTIGFTNNNNAATATLGKGSQQTATQKAKAALSGLLAQLQNSP